MTPEQRLDRLERIVKLFATQGRRIRNEFHQRIEMLIDAQVLNETRFARLSESQMHTAQRLDALIDIKREGGTESPSA